MGKRALKLAIVILLVVTLSVNAMARWTYTAFINQSLSFSGATAICSTVIEAHSSTATINATAILIRINSDKSETTVKIWAGLTGIGTLIFYDTYGVTRGFSYRLEIYATVSTTQGSENVSASVTAKCT